MESDCWFYVQIKMLIYGYLWKLKRRPKLKTSWLKDHSSKMIPIYFLHFIRPTWQARLPPALSRTQIFNKLDINFKIQWILLISDTWLLRGVLSTNTSSCCMQFHMTRKYYFKWPYLMHDIFLPSYLPCPERKEKLVIITSDKVKRHQIHFEEWQDTEILVTQKYDRK